MNRPFLGTAETNIITSIIIITHDWILPTRTKTFCLSALYFRYLNAFKEHHVQVIEMYSAWTNLIRTFCLVANRTWCCWMLQPFETGRHPCWGALCLYFIWEYDQRGTNIRLMTQGRAEKKKINFTRSPWTVLGCDASGEWANDWRRSLWWITQSVKSDFESRKWGCDKKSQPGCTRRRHQDRIPGWKHEK